MKAIDMKTLAVEFESAVVIRALRLQELAAQFGREMDLDECVELAKRY